MQLFGYGMFHGFFGADDVVYPDGNAPEPAGKGDRSYPYHMHVRPALGKCILRRDVWGMQGV